MDWIEQWRNLGWLFLCIGMVQQQKELTYREKFNIAVFCRAAGLQGRTKSGHQGNRQAVAICHRL